MYDLYTDAAYRFYRSRCEDESSRRRGKIPSKNRSKRKHERTTRVRCILLAVHLRIKLLLGLFWEKILPFICCYVATSPYLGLCAYVCWALWLYGRQSDMLGLYGRQSDMLGFVAVWLCGRQSDMLGFVAVWPSV